jgi:hypothetical protein
MAYSRVFGILDLEISQHLSFSFTVAENLTSPGLATVRANDRFRFHVWVENRSAIPLKLIEGTVQPTLFADFEPCRFLLPQLNPGKRRRVATIEGKVARVAEGEPVRFHQLGRVQVAASPDLSHVRLERSSPLVYVKTA